MHPNFLGGQNGEVFHCWKRRNPRKALIYQRQNFVGGQNGEVFHCWKRRNPRKAPMYQRRNFVWYTTGKLFIVSNNQNNQNFVGGNDACTKISLGDRTGKFSIVGNDEIRGKHPCTSAEISLGV